MSSPTPSRSSRPISSQPVVGGPQRDDRVEVAGLGRRPDGEPQHAVLLVHRPPVPHRALDLAVAEVAGAGAVEREAVDVGGAVERRPSRRRRSSPPPRARPMPRGRGGRATRRPAERRRRRRRPRPWPARRRRSRRRPWCRGRGRRAGAPPPRSRGTARSFPPVRCWGSQSARVVSPHQLLVRAQRGGLGPEPAAGPRLDEVEVGQRLRQHQPHDVAVLAGGHGGGVVVDGLEDLRSLRVGDVDRHHPGLGSVRRLVAVVHRRGRAGAVGADRHHGVAGEQDLAVVEVAEVEVAEPGDTRLVLAHVVGGELGAVEAHQHLAVGLHGVRLVDAGLLHGGAGLAAVGALDAGRLPREVGLLGVRGQRDPTVYVLVVRVGLVPAVGPHQVDAALDIALQQRLARLRRLQRAVERHRGGAVGGVAGAGARRVVTAGLGDDGAGEEGGGDAAEDGRGRSGRRSRRSGRWAAASASARSFSRWASRRMRSTGAGRTGSSSQWRSRSVMGCLPVSRVRGR